MRGEDSDDDGDDNDNHSVVLLGDVDSDDETVVPQNRSGAQRKRLARLEDKKITEEGDAKRTTSKVSNLTGNHNISAANDGNSSHSDASTNEIGRAHV